MEDHHTADWPEEIHKPKIWFCNFKPHKHQDFPEANDLQKHLLQEHKGKFTAGRIKRCLADNVVSRSRSSGLCPLCNRTVELSRGEPTPIVATSLHQPSQKSTKPKPSARRIRFQVPKKDEDSKDEDLQDEDPKDDDDEDDDDDDDDDVGSKGYSAAPSERSELVKHIADHLLSLAFISLRDYEDESGSEAHDSCESTEAADGEQALGSDRFSELGDLLSFEDVPPEDRSSLRGADADLDPAVSDETKDHSVEVEWSDWGPWIWSQKYSRSYRQRQNYQGKYSTLDSIDLINSL